MLMRRIFGLKRMSSAVVGMVLAVSLAEAGLRLWPPDWLGPRTGVAEDPESRVMTTGDTGWPIQEIGDDFVAFEPDATLEMRSPEYHVFGHSDRWGGRAGGLAAPSAPLIPVMGDSQTFGIGVADDETLVSRLARRHGRPFVNLGVPGTSLRDQLFILSTRHDALGRPRLYLFGFYAGNDLSDMVNDEALSGPAAEVPRSSGLLDSANRAIFHLWPLRRLHVLQLAKLAFLGTFRRVPTWQEDQIFGSADTQRVEFRAAAARELDRQLDRLHGLAARLGFRAVFFVVPDRYQVSPALLERAPDVLAQPRRSGHPVSQSSLAGCARRAGHPAGGSDRLHDEPRRLVLPRHAPLARGAPRDGRVHRGEARGPDQGRDALTATRRFGGGSREITI